MGLRVLITGVCSTLASAVLEELVKDPAIEKITGIDVQQYNGPYLNNIDFFRVDIRNSDGVETLLKNCHVLIHMAFVVVSNVPKKSEIHDININGSKNVFECAARCGVKKIIYTSSVAAYGMTKNSAEILTEDSPMLGIRQRNFYYAFTKASVELFLDQFEKVHPEMSIIRIRPHIITGPHFLTKTTNLSIYLNQIESQNKNYWSLKSLNYNFNNAGLIQLTAEQDLVAFIHFSIHNSIKGAYNLVGEPMNLEEYERSFGKEIKLIPWRVAQIFLVIASIFSKRARFGLAWVQGAKYHTIISSDKIEKVGFLAQQFALTSTRQCIEFALEFQKRSRKHY
jgi:UDP-glucose 4-epimerase